MSANNHRMLIDSLWLRLSLAFIILNIICMACLMIVSGAIWDYILFNKAINAQSLYQLVIEDKPNLIKMLQNPSDTDWINKNYDLLEKKLKNLELNNSGTIYKISASSFPQVNIALLNSQHQEITNKNISYPTELAELFNTKPKSVANDKSANYASKLSNDSIYLLVPIYNQDKILGHISLKFMATFNLLTDLKGGLDFVISAWLIILCSSIPIGLACGFVASKYVSSKLAIIHSTTKFWKNSDFSKRINWIKDDELGKHALFLNEMADELEKNFYLRQQIAVTNERNMVARALHDTVKQKLFALSLQIATIKSKISENEKIQPILSEAEAITSEAQYELMSIITKLKPAEINHLSCIAEIRKKSKELNRRLGIKIHINMADDIAIEQQHLLNIIKIIDESIINAVKHGRANEATISLFKKDKSNYLYIDDNGTGIKNFSFFTGIGINSMKERSHEIAESVLDIVNIKESGVRVSLVWPA